jgi:predicted metal-dependent phosphoesterase TrpH
MAPKKDKYLFDLHVHTIGSYDGRATPQAMCQVAKGRDLNGIAITDHDTLTRFESPYPDFLVVPGIEIRVETRDVWADLLGIGVQEMVPLGLGLAETVEAIHDAGGLAIVPHPFSSMKNYPAIGDTIHSIGDIIDGVEVTNPREHVDNARARKVANTHGVAKIGGSDAHTIDDVGVGVTICEPVGTIDQLLDLIEANRVEATIRKI